MVIDSGPAAIELFPIAQSQITVLVSLFGLAPTITGGGAVAARTLAIPRNAVVVSTFPAMVRVVHAEWFAARDVAQLRSAASGTAGVHAVVVDFGAARTVAAVASTTGSVLVTSVQRWLGASFESASLEMRPSLGAPGALASEVRTERLLVTCAGPSFDAVRDALAVRLPELPADLELRIDGGAPIWTSGGPVVAGPLTADAPALRLAPGAVANGSQRWRAVATSGSAPPSFEQALDLAAIVNALTNDPDAAHGDTREVTVSLTSRIPGAIGLDLPTAPLALLRHLARVTDGFVEGRQDVTFNSEGLHVVPLALPSWATSVHAASHLLAGSCDANRTLPPLGPDATLLDQSQARDGAVRPDAEFVVDGARSLALRLPADHGLLTVSAFCVPVRPDSSGCELRAVLLAAVGDPAGPGAPLDGGVGTPVVVDPAPDDGEQWVTLPLQSPYTIAAGHELYVALHVLRGTAALPALRLSASVTDTAGTPVSSSAPAAQATEGATPVWRGPPTGPWELVPDSADLRGLRGRLRVTGTAPNDRPIAPVRIALGRAPGRGDGVTPGPKGVPVQLAAGVAAAPVLLHVVALTPCTLTLRDVVVTVSAAGLPA
ncbi:MAG: hypothetical protein IT360_23525 [Gemmatimonadaceae bacterium]|nr:hypothetical protein [Gemmatimonadaceae bacterium]